MPDSPLSFFGPATWLDDDAIDRETMAERLGGGEFDSARFADALGVHGSSIRTYLMRGQLPKPKRYEDCTGGIRPLWSADAVAETYMARTM